MVEIKNEFLAQPNKPPKDPLCMVITSEKHILTRARAVYETWGHMKYIKIIQIFITWLMIMLMCLLIIYTNILNL